MIPLTETAFRKIIARISVGGRPNPSGLRITLEQFRIIDRELARQINNNMSASEAKRTAEYARKWQVRIVESKQITDEWWEQVDSTDPTKVKIVDETKNTMQKEIKVDRPDPDMPEPTVGDLIEGDHNGNVFLVLRVDKYSYYVHTLATRGTAPNAPFNLPKEDTKPFIGEVTITQRP